MDIDTIASELIDALDQAALVPLITARADGFDLSAAYAVSAELARRRRDRGERSIGRKLGFTNRALWTTLGVDSPFWGHVYDSTVTLLGSPTGSVAIGRLTQPRLEPELVLHFGSTPPGDAGEEEIMAHVDWIAFGYEVVQCHFQDWSFRTADAVADFGVHGALVVGPPTPLTALSDPVTALRDFTITLMRNGEQQAHGGGVNVLGSPPLALATVVATASNFPGWEPIRAGEIVTTGTLTGLHMVQPGETWTVEIAGISLEGVSLHTDQNRDDLGVV